MFGAMMAATNLAFADDLLPLRETLQRLVGGHLSVLAPERRDYLASETSNRPHLVAVPSSSAEASSLPRHEMYDMESAVTWTQKTRTLVEPAPIARMDERGLAQVVSKALNEAYGEYSSPAKRVANDCGASVGSAKNWLAGVAPPSSVYLARLEAKVPALAAEMRRLRAMEADINPDFQREFVALMQRYGAR